MADVYDSLNSQANTILSGPRIDTSLPQYVQIGDFTYRTNELSKYYNKIDPYLDQGASYEDISKATGYDDALIRAYADASRPGYGVTDTSTASTSEPASTTSYSTGGSGTAAYTDADLAYLDLQKSMLQKVLGRADNTLNQGLIELGDSYNRQRDDANLQRTRALENYQIQRDDSQRGKQSALDTVDRNTRTLADSVRRILGMASGTGSSAFRFAAPDAIGRLASENRSGVMNTYGANDRNLTLAENRATDDFKKLLEDLATQRGEKEQMLRTGVIEQKNSINEQLANLEAEKQMLLGGSYDQIIGAQQPYVNAVDSGNTAIDRLISQFRTPYNVRKVNPQTPDLKDYTVDRAAINANRQAGGNSPTSPYSYFLKRKFDENV